MIVGFPASRNSTNPIDREVIAAPYGYRSESVDEGAYLTSGLSPETHVVLPLDLKRGFDLQGNHRNFPKPQGMSGAPIWVLLDEEQPNDARVFPVVAIGTRYRKGDRVLIGTDIRVVMDMIREAG